MNLQIDNSSSQNEQFIEPMSLGTGSEIESFYDEEKHSNNFNSNKSFFSLAKLNICGCHDNIFVLCCLLVGTSSFTIAQFIGAYKANSLAMYGDCATMALDSLTYMLNIYCENRRISGSLEALQLEVLVASISVASLTFVTIILLWDSLKRLHDSQPGENTVDASIMLKFSILNFIVDIISCSIFLSNSNDSNGINKPVPNSVYNPIYKADSPLNGRVKIEVSRDVDLEIIDRRRSSYISVKESPRNLNMASAFLHLGADTLRTITILVTALIVEGESRKIDSVDADAIGSIIVCIIILAVVVALCLELAGLTRTLKGYTQENEQRKYSLHTAVES